MEKNHISHFSDNTVEKLFGTLANATEVYKYTLTNHKGLEVTFITYGAAIQSLMVDDKNGNKTDVVLGFDTIEGYVASYDLPSPPYFGAIIGRYAGRIANGSFQIDDKLYKLDKNLGENTLHGGKFGFCRVNWEVKDVKQGTDSASITFSYTSPDGDEHFPGDLITEVTYTLTSDNEIAVDYKAVSTEDTVINLTQHSYFNLDGHKGNVQNQQLMVNSEWLVDITDDGIPTSNYIEAHKKGYDFRILSSCPAKIDNSFVINDNTKPVALLTSQENGLKMTVYTDQPSVHVYVGGNCFGEIPGKEGVAYHPQSGICFETQNYPDAPNKPGFPNAVLRKGEEYTQLTVWKFETI